MIRPRMSRWILIPIVGLALGLTILIPSSSEAQTPPDRRFGMTEVFWLPDEAKELGVGWERILFYWREIQPEGPEDWNTLHVREEWLDEAATQGREVVGLIKNTAPWAAVDGTEAGLPKGLNLPLDHPDNLWANYVRRLADYYGQRGVHHWIIWNEPEIEPGVYGFEFAGSATDYYQLLKTAYKVIKDRDPQAVIHLAGLTWWHDPTFLGRLLAIAAADPEATGNGYFFDVISLHVYFRTETIRSIIDEVNQIQGRYGLAKPIWINETNAPPNRDPEWPVDRPRFNIDLEQQAWFIVQAMALGFASGAERISVYKLLDIHLPPGGESFGVLRPDQSRRPAFDAFKMATHCLAAFDEVEIGVDPRYYHVTFGRPGTLTHVAWSRTPAAAEVRIEANADNAAALSLAGTVTQVKSDEGVFTLELPGQRCDQECLVGGEPLLLVEETGEGSLAATCLTFTADPVEPVPTEVVTVAGSETEANDDAAMEAEFERDEEAGGKQESAPNVSEADVGMDSQVVPNSGGDSGSPFEVGASALVEAEAATPAVKNAPTSGGTTSGAASQGDDGGSAGLWVLGLAAGLGLMILFFAVGTRAGRPS